MLDLRRHCHVIGKYKVPALRDCNINITLNYKISIVLHNFKNYDAYFIM